jgi:hypothetical protein
MVLNNRLIKFCDEHGVIDERQASHRKNSRTSDNAFIIRSLFEKYCTRQNKKLYACFVDFRKAFDSIWHDALFLKLLRCEISGPFYKVIKDMYQKVTASVKSQSGNSLSGIFPINKGVKQGDVLSPLLFNIFINDIIPLLQEPDCQPPSLIEQLVGCLLYADDLVIISTSPEGLQRSLDKLHSYCTKWKLELNLTKSKVMSFSKHKNTPKEKFTFAGEELEKVEKYTYLGFEIASNGAFKIAEKAIADKAARAMFKLKSLLRHSQLDPSISLKMFDQLIKPICMYGSELWGPDCIKMSANDNKKFFTSIEKLCCEKLNMSFCKFTLGVHRKSQNSAVRGELGRTPIGIDVVANMLKYKKHLESKSPQSVLGEALINCTKNESKTLNWALGCKRVENYIQNASIGKIDLSNRKSVIQCLNVQYTNMWSDKIHSEPKMRTYILFKNAFHFEDYLLLHNEKHRIATTRLRISAHNLAIERGRYTSPPTPAANRICKHCNGHKVEDEYHFVMKCTKYEIQRNELFQKIAREVPLFDQLKDEDKFTYMLSSGIEILKLVAAFIYDNLP